MDIQAIIKVSTEAAQAAMESLKGKVEELKNALGVTYVIKVDTSAAVTALDDLKKTVEDDAASVRVNADTSAAKKSVDDLKKTVEGVNFDALTRVSTGEAVESVKDLRANISELRTAMNEAAVGSDEYKAASTALKEAQSTLKVVIGTNTDSISAARDTVKGATGSYADLSAQMAALRQAWKATNDEAARNELGNQIMAINTQLKNMDASVGNYQRNVGNYSSALDGLADSLKNVQMMTGGASALLAPFAQGINMVNAAMKLLAANPLLAALGGLVIVIQLVIKVVKSSEERMNQWREAIAKLQPVFDVLQNILTEVSKVLIKVIGYIVDLGTEVAKLATKFVGGSKALDEFNKKTEQANRLAAEGIELQKRRREVDDLTYDTERDIAELREKAGADDLYNAKQRLAFLQEAIKKTKELGKEQEAVARREYELIKEKNSLTESSTEDIEKERQAYRNLQETITGTSTSVRTLEKSARSIRNTINSEAQAAAEAVRQRSAEARDAAIKAAEELTAAIKTNAEMQLALFQKYSDDYTALYLKMIDDETAAKKQAASDSIKDSQVLADALRLIDATAAKEKADYQKEADDEYLSQQAANRELELGLYEKYTDEYTTVYEQILNDRKNAAIREAEDEIADEVTKQERIMLIQAQYADDMATYADEHDQYQREQYTNDALAAVNAEIKKWEDKKSSLEEGSSEYLQAEIDQRQAELDALKEIDLTKVDNAEEINDMIAKAEDNLYTALKAKRDKDKKDQEESFKKAVKTAQAFADSMSSLLDTVGNAYMEEAQRRLDAGEITDAEAQEEFERGKKMQIAATTVNTIAGAAGALLQAMKTYAAPWGAIIGSAQAAAALVAGQQQIAEIKAQTLDTGDSTSTSTSSVTSAATSINDVVTEVPELPSGVDSTILTNTQSQTDYMDQASASQRVYVVESDIREVGSRVAVAEAEATF